MEAAVNNLVSPETQFYAWGRIFGNRWVELCQAYGAKLHVWSSRGTVELTPGRLVNIKAAS